MAARKIIFKVLGVLVGIGIMFVANQERSALTQARSIGKLATVAPIEGYTTRKSKRSTTYTAQFNFTTEKGEKVSQQKAFPEVLIKDFDSGVPVKVLYDPNSPGTFVFEKDEPTWMFVGLGAAIIVAVLVFL
jgi:hypothetical protein